MNADSTLMINAIEAFNFDDFDVEVSVVVVCVFSILLHPTKPSPCRPFERIWQMLSVMRPAEAKWKRRLLELK